jgi:hypothetical protein
MSNAREIALQSTEWLKATDIAERSGGSSNDLSLILHHWMSDRRIFAINIQGVDHFPAYGFRKVEHANTLTLEPKPIMATLIASFGNECSHWRLAEWLASPNGYLHGKRPMDLLDCEPDRVVKAAEFESLGIQHG